MRQSEKRLYKSQPENGPPLFTNLGGMTNFINIYVDFFHTYEEIHSKMLPKDGKVVEKSPNLIKP